MDPTDGAALTPRVRRAITLIAASLTVIVVAGLLYLHPNPGGPTASQPSPRPSPTPMLADNYQAVYQFVTPLLGWAVVGNMGYNSSFWIFNTTDGARHWEAQYSGRRDPGSYGSLQVRFFGRSSGIVTTGGDSFLRTDDGGSHWIKFGLPLSGIMTVTFSDPEHGWIRNYPRDPLSAGDLTMLLSTSDGGKTWTPLPPARGMTEVVFRSPGEGWAGTMDPYRPSVYSSKDGGATWSAHPLPVTVNPIEGKPWITMTHVVLIPGGVIAMVTSTALASFDGGETWRELLPAPGVPYYQVAFEDTMHWWAMGMDGVLFKTADAGQSWDRVSVPNDYILYRIGVIDSKHAWALVTTRPPRPGSGLAMTSDGGLHWTYARVPTPPQSFT